jgi:tRNA G26 N,N-dimethylase Trm1
LECDRRGLELTEERALFCAECKKASVKKKGGEFKLKCERCGVELSEQGAVFCVGCAEKIYSSLPD